MGYESKCVIVERKECESPDGSKWVYGGEIARFDLSEMGYETVNGKMFREVFKTPIDFDIYVNPDDGNEHSWEYWREDFYGEHCKWATVDEVLAWLDASDVVKKQHYRRATLFRDFLFVLKLNHEHDFNQICVVHYGY